MIHHYESYVSEPQLSKIDLIAKALKVKTSALLESHEEEDPSDAGRFDTRSLRSCVTFWSCLPTTDHSFTVLSAASPERTNSRATRGKDKRN